MKNNIEILIICGGQGTGKTTELNNSGADILDAECLSIYPLQFPSNIRPKHQIAFDEVTELKHFYMLAFISCQTSMFIYKKLAHTMQRTLIQLENYKIIVASQLPKNSINHIFKGLPNVKIKELKLIL